MPDFERFEEFSEGSVSDASITLRPDAVVPLVAQCAGPVAIGDTSSGLLARGWYARADEDLGKILIAVAEGASTWGEESELLDIPGAGGEVEMISLAFDVQGRPVVAVKIQSEGIFAYRYQESSSGYVTDEVAPSGKNPALVGRASGTAFQEVVLFYQEGLSILYRFHVEDFQEEYDTEENLSSDQELWRAIDGEGGRLHLIYSEWNEATGTYTLGRLSEESSFSASCLETDGEDDVVALGVDSVVVFRGDGFLTARCDIECDFLIFGAGGDAGDAGKAQDSVVWADTTTGLALDPESDPVPTDLRARGGGHGASQDFDGSTGGSGGGGGGASPSNNAMWTQGGGIFSGEGQGNPGGGGQSTWGLLDPKRAASGGGGGYAGAGGGGTTLQGSPLANGGGGGGGYIFSWGWPGPKGGDGYQLETTSASTGSVPGGGGAGGVEEYNGLIIPAGQTIPIRVGAGFLGAQAGEGGGDQNTGEGITGMVAVKIRRVDLSEKTPAAAENLITGGVEAVLDDYRYFTFTSDGTLTVAGEGSIEAVLVGGGGGGGSDAGGGGGSGEVKVVEMLVTKNQEVTVGAGGAGGTSGAVGSDGEDTSLGSMTAQGGGGGAGQGTGAGSRASGGGGHGDEGDPGAGKTFRAFGGGPGAGYSLAGGGDARHAGGGGGVGSPGRKGATQETTGEALADNWENPSTGGIIESDNTYRITLGGGQHYGIIGELVSRGEMMVQGKVLSGSGNLDVGIRSRGQHDGGGDDDPTEGWRARINHTNQEFNGQQYFFDLSTFHTIQSYVADDLQEHAVFGSNGTPRVESVVRQSGTDAGLNGEDTRSFGFYAEGTPVSGTNKQAIADHVCCFASKYLTLGNVSTGSRAEVLNGDDEIVAEGTESGGEIQVDLSMFGDGSSGASEPVPIPGGFPRVKIYDSGDSLVADVGGSFHPGGEFDLSGSDLEVVVDSSGAEPIPVIGLLQYSDFSETTPGPEIGDGGDGIELDDPDWATATGIGDDDDFLGGGGGAGSEATIAGRGGNGGGGDGAFDTETPEDGEANTGGGGGGSGDSTVDGGDGGSGLVVVRSLRFDPDEVPEASRFSASAVDQDDEEGLDLQSADTEVVSFGDVNEWDGETAFTVVVRFQPDSTSSARTVWSRYDADASPDERVIEFIQRSGTDPGVLISENGGDYAALWVTGGWSPGADRTFAIVFDGSLSGPGGQNRNRLKLFRDDNDGSGFSEEAWSNFFGDGRSDVPPSLNSPAIPVLELLGDRADGNRNPAPGFWRLFAVKYGTAYSIAELDAMDLADKDEIDSSDWDRLYRFKGHIADEAGSTDGEFIDPI